MEEWNNKWLSCASSKCLGGINILLMKLVSLQSQFACAMKVNIEYAQALWKGSYSQTITCHVSTVG